MIPEGFEVYKMSQFFKNADDTNNGFEAYFLRDPSTSHIAGFMYDDHAKIKIQGKKNSYTLLFYEVHGNASKFDYKLINPGMEWYGEFIDNGRRPQQIKTHVEQLSDIDSEYLTENDVEECVRYLEEVNAFPSMRLKNWQIELNFTSISSGAGG